MGVSKKVMVQVTSSLLLAVATITLLAVFTTNGLAGSSNAQKYGFKNATGDISDQFYTQVTPAGYTFAIWGVIYAWQTLWIIYAWSFTCRPSKTWPIFTGVYISYTIANCFNIAWIYIWGNEYVVAASVILILLDVALYASIAQLFGYFHTMKDKATKVDTILTYALPMNGLCCYATWTTIASLINLTAAVQTTTSISDADMATVSLTILLVLLLTYFILENTILDTYGFRNVYSVYPVVVWALTGVLVAQWGKDGGKRNSYYTLALLLVAVVLFIVKLVLSARKNVLAHAHRQPTESGSLIAKSSPK